MKESRVRTLVVGASEVRLRKRRGRFVFAYPREREGMETELCFYGGVRGREQFVSVYAEGIQTIHRKTRKV